MNQRYKRIIVKVGSNVITQSSGLPDDDRIRHLVEQLAAIKNSGVEVILVSSGAVASGRSLITIAEKHRPVAARQLLSSVGQVKLINTYSALFDQHGMLCAQVLVTKEDFRDRAHYLNIQNCLHILLQHQVIPIVNENDVVSVTELMFTDNDELAGLIASMLHADALIILSNVDGIFTGDPKDPGSVLIEEISGNEIDLSAVVKAEKSEFGRGGMITKANMARKVAKLGIAVHIANGKRDDVLTGVLRGNLKHTRFVPGKRTSGKKNWIAHAENTATGIVKLNEGARKVLTSGKATSLLPVGVVAILADFKKGDIIRIVDEHETTVGLGIAQYGAEKARERLGMQHQKPLVHYDYFYAVI